MCVREKNTRYIYICIHIFVYIVCVGMNDQISSKEARLSLLSKHRKEGFGLETQKATGKPKDPANLGVWNATCLGHFNSGLWGHYSLHVAAGPQFHGPRFLMVSYASNIPQDDVSIYLGLCINCIVYISPDTGLNDVSMSHLTILWRFCDGFLNAHLTGMFQASPPQAPLF